MSAFQEATISMLLGPNEEERVQVALATAAGAGAGALLLRGSAVRMTLGALFGAFGGQVLYGAVLRQVPERTSVGIEYLPGGM